MMLGEAALENSKEFMMPDRSWDFPLTRAEKFDRLIMTFQTDLALSEREIKALRIQLQLASGHQGGHQDSECSQRETLMSREESTSGLDHVRLACKCTCRCGATSSISGPDAGVADAQMLATPQALKLCLPCQWRHCSQAVWPRSAQRAPRKLGFPFSFFETVYGSKGVDVQLT